MYPNTDGIFTPPPNPVSCDMTKELKTTVDDDLYSEVAALADSMDESKAEIQRRALRAYIEDGASEPTDSPTTFDSKLDDIRDHDLEDGPHDIALARDPDVDWTSKDVVSRTYRERLPVLNAWLNDEAKRRVDDETLDEMLTDEEVGFGLVRQTGYSDRERLQEYGIAFPSPAVDPAWDRGDLLRRCHEIKVRETKSGDIHQKPSSLEELLVHKVEEGGETVPVWCFEEEWFLDKRQYEATLRRFLTRLQKVIEGTDIDSGVNKMYRVVLADYMKYLEEIDRCQDERDRVRDWLDDFSKESVRESVEEELEQIEQADPVE